METSALLGLAASSTLELLETVPWRGRLPSSGENPQAPESPLTPAPRSERVLVGISLLDALRRALRRSW